MKDEQTNPYAAPTVQEPDVVAENRSDSFRFMSSVGIALGFAAAVSYVDGFDFSDTKRTIGMLLWGKGMWIGWGILAVSFSVMYLKTRYLRLGARTQFVLSGFSGCAATLLVKYLLDGHLR